VLHYFLKVTSPTLIIANQHNSVIESYQFLTFIKLALTILKR